MNVARRPDLGAGSVFSGVMVVASESSGVGTRSRVMVLGSKLFTTANSVGVSVTSSGREELPMPSISQWNRPGSNPCCDPVHRTKPRSKTNTRSMAAGIVARAGPNEAVVFLRGESV